MTAPDQHKPNRPLGLLAALVLLIAMFATIVVVSPPSSDPLRQDAGNTPAARPGAPSGERAPQTLAPAEHAQPLSAIPKRPKITSGDVGSVYLEAYMMADEAGKLAESGNTAAARAKYLEAERLIERIRASLPEWRSQVVSYRKRKIAEAIQQLSEPKNDFRYKQQSTPSGDSSQGLGDIYLQAFMLATEASKLEPKGDHQGALERYEDALVILDHISKANPGWRPEVVQYRTRKVTESIARVAQN